MHERDGDVDRHWAAAWTQAVSDYRVDGDEPPFDDVTVHMAVPASLGGTSVRVELSNQYNDDPVRIGRGAIGVGDRRVELTFDGQRRVEIPAGRSRRTDPVDLAVASGDEVVVDLYLPEPTAFATVGGFRYERSVPGDFAGARPFPLEGSTPAEVDAAREFPATSTGATTEPDGSGWSLPAGGPFLRAVEVSGVEARAVVVALGGSSTAMGWPQYAAAMLPATDRIAVVNRGIAGNRIRLDAPSQTPSWGRAGLARFDDDVLGTAGVTHVVIAYNSNDWGLPGRVTPLEEMPTVEQVIAGYEELVARTRQAGLTAVLATVTPLSPELLADPGREDFRLAVNEWIRSADCAFVDFDAAIRSESDPSRLDDRYAAPDHTHPSIDGSKHLAQEMVQTLARLPL